MSAFGRDHDVLDADPEFAGQVDAGFDAEAVAGLEDELAAADDEWVLVHVHPEPVAGSVDEVLAVAGIGDDGSCRAVDGARGDSRLAGTSGGHVGCVDDSVDLFGLVGRGPHADGAGDVAVVVLVFAPEIEDEGVSFGEDGVVGEVMRLGGVGSGGDDGKGWLSASVRHRVAQEAGDLSFRHACFDLGEDFDERFIGDVARLEEEVDFARFFDPH